MKIKIKIIDAFAFDVERLHKQAIERNFLVQTKYTTYCSEYCFSSCPASFSPFSRLLVPLWSAAESIVCRCGERESRAAKRFLAFRFYKRFGCRASPSLGFIRSEFIRVSARMQWNRRGRYPAVRTTLPVLLILSIHQNIITYYYLLLYKCVQLILDLNSLWNCRCTWTTTKWVHRFLVPRFLISRTTKNYQTMTKLKCDWENSWLNIIAGEIFGSLFGGYPLLSFFLIISKICVVFNGSWPSTPWRIRSKWNFSVSDHRGWGERNKSKRK